MHPQHACRVQPLLGVEAALGLLRRPADKGHQTAGPKREGDQSDFGPRASFKEQRHRQDPETKLDDEERVVQLQVEPGQNQTVQLPNGYGQHRQGEGRRAEPRSMQIGEDPHEKEQPQRRQQRQQNEHQASEAGALNPLPPRERGRQGQHRQAEGQGQAEPSRPETAVVTAKGGDR